MDQKRFLLAMVLSGAVLVVWQAFFAPEPPDEETQKKAKETQTASETPDGEASADNKDEESADREASRQKQPDDGQLGRPQGDDGSEADEKKADGTPSDEKLGRKADTDDDGESADETGDETGDESGDATAEATDTDDADRDADQQQGDAKAAPDESDGESGELGKKVMEETDSSETDIPVETHVLKSDRVKVTVTNDGGGRVQAINLLKPAQYQKRGNLLGSFPDDSPHHPFGTTFFDRDRPLGADTPYEFVESASQKADDGTWKKVVYRYKDGKDRFQIDKIFRMVGDQPYVLKMDLEITNNMEGRMLGDRLTVDSFGYKDPDEETSFLNFRPNNIQGVCRMGDVTQRTAHSSIENPLVYESKKARWGAVNTRYFIWAMIPEEEAADKCAIEKVDRDYVRTRLTFKEFSVSGQSTEKVSHKLFVGPKQVDMLNEVGHSLSSSVDYGLFAFIARPLRWMLAKIQSFVINWGLAIILLTVLIKLLTWPINMKAYRSMDGMKKIQPELEDIREKYEDDRQKMTEETMKLFQEHDVSPMGGCLPMLLQMPILYGLYVMIYSSVELYHADFILWYDNLAAPDPYYVLPVIMGVVMFGQQNMMGSAGANAQAKIMTKVMPVIFTAFMLFLPSGLVLYYSINLLIGLGQQFWVRSQREAAEDEAEPAGA